MLRFIIIALILWLPFSAKAKTVQTIENLCKTVSNHDIHGADYVPSYDIDGNPVVPADLGPDYSVLGDQIIIPITADIQKHILKDYPDLIDLEGYITSMKIKKDGRILLGDQEISKQVTALCSADKLPETQEKTTTEGLKGNRQVPEDNVGSSDIIKGQYPDDEDKKPSYND